MPLTLEVHDINRKIVEQIELSEKVFNEKYVPHLMHSAVVYHMTNQRSGTSSTKTKSEVSGTGAKPWKQKGTGRARAGTLRSPLRRGGGVAFGPKPRGFKNNLTKKERQKALSSALSKRIKEDNVLVLDKVSLDQPKTKQLKALLAKLKIETNVLFLETGENKNLELAARNLKGVNVIYVDSLNTYNVVYYEKIIITKEALIELNKKLES